MRRGLGVIIEGLHLLHCVVGIEKRTTNEDVSAIHFLVPRHRPHTVENLVVIAKDHRLLANHRALQLHGTVFESPELISNNTSSASEVALTPRAVANADRQTAGTLQLDDPMHLFPHKMMLSPQNPALTALLLAPEAPRAPKLPKPHPLHPPNKLRTTPQPVFSPPKPTQ